MIVYGFLHRIALVAAIPFPPLRRCPIYTLGPWKTITKGHSQLYRIPEANHTLKFRIAVIPGQFLLFHATTKIDGADTGRPLRF